MSHSELALLFVIASAAVAIFTVSIVVLVRAAKDLGYYKKVAEDNAKAVKDLKKADDIILTDVTDGDIVRKLRGGKF